MEVLVCAFSYPCIVLIEELKVSSQRKNCRDAVLLKVLGRPLISLDFASEEPDLSFVIFQSVNSSPGSLKVLGRASL